MDKKGRVCASCRWINGLNRWQLGRLNRVVAAGGLSTLITQAERI